MFLFSEFLFCVMPSFTFHKNERLTNKKKISQLFSKGESINAYPLRLIYSVTQENSISPIQFAFTVPKRSFKKAVQRNFIKRRIKESFRLNKHKIKDLISNQNESIYGIFIYIGKDIADFHTIDKEMNKLISKLCNKLS